MKYDLVVVGGGSAGTSAAVEGARLGARVLLINDGLIGGTCVNVGCVPSKYLLKVAGLFGKDRYPGVKLGVEITSFPKMMEGLRAVVGKYRKDKYENVLARNGVEIMEGRAKLVSPGRVEVGDRIVEAGALIWATGSSPYVPSIEGLESVPYLTNLNLFNLRSLPRRLIIVGGGYVGVEMAQAFRRLGSDVVLIHRGRHLLSHEDEDVALEVEGILRDDGVEVMLKSSPVKVEGVEGDLSIVLRDGKRLEGTHLLFATGRKGNTEDLNLEGVQLHGRGFVRVNRRMETGVPGLYAAGDVVGPPMYVYVAAREGKVAALNALTGAGLEVDYDKVPFVIFTHPQVAGVGPTEETLMKRGIIYKRTVIGAENVPVEGILPGSRGFIKVLKDEDDRLLSLRVVMRNAGEMVTVATLSLGRRVRDITDAFFPYLTHTEGLRIALLSFDRETEDMSCCAG